MLLKNLLNIYQIFLSEYKFATLSPAPALNVKLSMETSPMPRMVSVALFTMPMVVAMVQLFLMLKY
jgi:hypothetical protein